MTGGAGFTSPHVLKRLGATAAFVLLSCTFGLFFAYRTPLLWGFDETSHVARAYQISQGHVLARYLGGDRPGLGYGGQVPANLLTLIVYVDHDVSSGTGRPHVHDPQGYATLGRLSLASPGELYAFTNTAEYSPVSYIPSVSAIKAAEVLGLDLGSTIHLARLADLAFYTGCLACALHVLRKSGFKWVVFAVGLLPVSIFQASTITADTVTNAVAFLLSAVVVKALFVEGRLSRADETLLFVTALTVPVLKPTYLLLDLLVVLIPAESFTSRRPALAVKVGAVLLGFAGFVAWQMATSNVVADLGLMRPGPGWQLVSPHHQLDYVVAHPLSALATLGRSLGVHGRGYGQEMFGQLSFGNVNIPALSVLLSALSMLVAALSVGSGQPAKRGRVAAIAAVVAASSLLIFLVEYLSWSNVGADVVRGVNGRYFVPLFVVAVSALAVVSPVRAAGARTVLARRSGQDMVGVLIGTLVVVSLVLSCVRFDHALWA